jgi:hypothetical protein
LSTNKHACTNYQALPKTFTISRGEYNLLCEFLGTISHELIKQFNKTKKKQKEYHVNCCFYFDQITDDQIQTFNKLKVSVYNAKEDKINQLLLKVKEGA